MTSRERQGESPASIFHDNLTDFLGDTEGQSIAEVKKELAESGINIEPIVTTIKTKVKMCLSEAKRSWLTEAPEQRNLIMERIKQCLIDIPTDVATLRDRIRELTSVGANRETAGAFFRNFNDMPDEDLRNLYKEYMELQALNQGQSGE